MRNLASIVEEVIEMCNDSGRSFVFYKRSHTKKPLFGIEKIICGLGIKDGKYFDKQWIMGDAQHQVLWQIFFLFYWGNILTNI